MEFTKSPIIIRIVSILDITRLSILDLFEYGLTLKAINYSMSNGFMRYDKVVMPTNNEEHKALDIPLTGDYYYNHLNSKEKLNAIGLCILESIRANPTEDKFPNSSQVRSMDPDRRDVSDI